MGKAMGYLTQHMDKEEKRSKAMGDAVRFLTDMDRSYLGQVRPRCSDTCLYCPQSFSGGGLYLNVNWLLWSVNGGLLRSVLMVTMYDWLLLSVKNGLL